MSEVTLSVGGRNYTIACEDGQEDHVRNLAGMIEERLEAMGTNQSAFEAKNLLFAGLFLADELTEAKKTIGSGSGGSGSGALSGGVSTDELASGLEKIADRLENSAAQLERG
jgi:cell division protein ZapA